MISFMRKGIILLVTLSISFFSFTQVLVPYKQNGLWGYSNPLGSVMISPKYTKVDFFDKFGGKVWQDSLIGYINFNGDELVKPNFTEVIPLTDSVFKVNQNGKWRLIDVIGNSLFNEDYDGIYELNNYRGQDIYSSHKPMPTLRYFQVKNKGKYGIILVDTQSKTGTTVTALKYHKIERISNPFTKNMVRFFKVQENGKQGVIRVTNIDYKTIIDSKYKYLYYNRNSREFYCQTLEEEVIFDESGVEKKRASLDEISDEEVVADLDFFGDLDDEIHYPIYKTLKTKNLYGLITTYRKKVKREWVIYSDTIESIYDTIIRPYGSEKCYIVSLNNNWGAVKSNGEYIVSPLYDEINIRSKKLIRMRRGLMDQYRFIVKKDNKYGVVGNVDQYGGISSNGYQILPIIYDEINMDNMKDYYFVKLNNKCGVISASNYKTLLQPKYAEVSLKIKTYKWLKLFQVKPTKDSEYMYVSMTGVEYFK